MTRKCKLSMLVVAVLCASVLAINAGADSLGSPLIGAAWDDLRFPLTRTFQGAVDKPDYDYTNMGLLFPQNDATEIIYVTAQMPHSWRLESAIYPHWHYVQDEADEPVFKIDYRWYNEGDDPTGSFTTLTCSTFAFAYTSGSILQIVGCPAIDGTGKGLSSMLDIKGYRDDNVVTGDVLGKEFDIHYNKDRLGSLLEYVK